MLAKKQLQRLLMQYKKLHPNETFDEEKLAHWINYQICEEALTAKNSITVLSAALKVLEGELDKNPSCITLTRISDKMFVANLFRDGESINNSINMSENDPLADALVRLARDSMGA